MLQQDDFDRFVRNYNIDYMYLLTRASHGDYDCLIASFTVLKDLYEVVLKLHDTLRLEFRVVPYPLSFRSNDELLKSFGFDAGQISNIYLFLAYVKRTQGKEFEEVLEEGLSAKCAKISSP